MPTERGGRGDTTASPEPRAEAHVSVDPAPAASIPRASRPTRYEGANQRIVITIDRKKKRRKKKKYSPGLKQAQLLEGGVSKAAQRISRAFDRGLGTYRKRRNKSARKRRDGAIIDGLRNLSRGVGKTLRVASDAPYDIAKQIKVRRFRRGVRDTIRVFTFPLFR